MKNDDMHSPPGNFELAQEGKGVLCAGRATESASAMLEAADESLSRSGRS